MTGLAMGQPLQVVEGRDTMAQILPVTLGPRAAAAAILRAYLECADFTVWGGEAPNVTFRFNAVRSTWATPNETMDYPVASIIEMEVETPGANLVPFPVEESWNLHCPGTVLWKTGEAQIRYQLDAWLNTEAHREAVEARILPLFNPGEGRSGVLLSGHSRYYCAPLRATVTGYELINDEGTSFNRERRLRVLIRGEIDELQLRRAVDLTPIFLPSDLGG